MIDLINNNAVSVLTIVIIVLAAAVAKVAYREGYKQGRADVLQVQTQVAFARALGEQLGRAAPDARMPPDHE